MGTRGFITFAVDGKDKTAYNHWDSYPDGLGLTVLNFLRAHRHELTCDIHRSQSGSVTDLARKLRVVDPDSVPSERDIISLRKFADEGVGTGQLTDWYVLLRRTQGDPGLMLEAGVIEDAKDFPGDSLFAEWGYAVDFDTQVLEVYRGFQKAPHNRGRFAGIDASREGLATGPYYPVALAASWPFSALPSDEEFVEAAQKAPWMEEGE